MVRYWAHVEYFEGGLIRVFEEGKLYHKDPYVYAIAFKVSDDPTEIELVGATKAPTFSQLRAIVTELRQRGLRVVRLRINGARPGRREIS